MVSILGVLSDEHEVIVSKSIGIKPTSLDFEVFMSANKLSNKLSVANLLVTRMKNNVCFSHGYLNGDVR